MGFRENLKSQLEYSGMLVKELAALSGVKKKTVDSYLSIHNNKPSVDAAVSIAKALGVTVEYLVTGKDVKERPIASFHKDLQEILLACEQLSSKDRSIILHLARLLNNR